MNTRLITDQTEPIDALLAGAEKLYKVVSTTMGPMGNNVIFRKAGKKAGITHDGVTVAKFVTLNDAAEETGAEILREAAMKMEDITGDGTTTVTVLAYEILKEARDRISKGENPMQLRKALTKDVTTVIAELRELVRKDISKKQAIQVATISAGDYDIGQEVGNVIYEEGFDTPVIVDIHDEQTTQIEKISGFKVGAGTASTYLLDGLRNELDDPYIAVVDGTLQQKEDILPLLQLISQLPPDEKQISIIASKVLGDALSVLAVNKVKGFANISVTVVPDTVKNKGLFLKDLAKSCGAEVMTNDNISFYSPTLEYLGRAKKVIAELDETTIIEGHSVGLQEYIDELEDNSLSVEVREFNKQRVAKLNQKVVTIHVGAPTYTDAEEQKYRYDDAVGATRAALRFGILAGGGSALKYVSQTLPEASLLKNALQAPMAKVLSNAGLKAPDSVKYGEGIDATGTGTVVDMFKAGIIDPSQSEIECVHTAASVAGLLMTSGAIVVDEEDKNEIT